MFQPQQSATVTITMELTRGNQAEVPRDHYFVFRVRPSDKFRFWEPPFDHPDTDGRQRQNLNIETGQGQLTFYGLSSRQLADLHSQIGEILALPATPVQHFTQEEIDKLIAEYEASATIEQSTPDQPMRADGYTL